MVSTTSLVFMCLTALFTTLGPIIAAILFHKRQKYYLGSVFIGAAVFFLFQMVARIPLITLVLPNMQWYKDMSANLWANALFLGFTAGLFEEAGRYLAFILVLKKHQDWKNAVAFGIGHGGIEAILLVGLTNISNLMTSIMINSGLYEAMIAQAPEQSREALVQVKNVLVQTQPSMFLIASAERLFTFFIHIALSILVMAGVQKKKGLLYLGFAILLHMLIDSPVVILLGYGVDIWIVEAFVLVLAVVSFFYIRKTGKREGFAPAPTA